jgi:beta-xylosidase
VSVARGPSIEGPFEGAPGNPILQPAGTGSSVGCVGHADLVRGPQGQDLLVVLATRKAGSYAPLGRETFVTGVEWSDGWPKPTPVELNPRPEPLEEDFDFADDDALADPGWLAVGRTPAEIAVTGDRPGRLTIRATSGGLEEFRPDFIGRRQRHIKSLFETRVDASGGRGGLGLRCDDEFTLALVAENAQYGTGTQVTARANLPTITRSWTAQVAGDEVLLRMETDGPTPGGPPWKGTGDRIRLSVVDGTGAETLLAELDGRFWAVETAAPFTGRVAGVFAEEGVVHFTRFRYRGQDHG